MQCVVFDMDGVLFDSEALVLRSWEQTAEIHGIPDVREVCLRCLGTNAAESRRLFLEKYGADFPYDTYKAEMSARYWENVGEGKLELKPGVREILDALRQNGWKPPSPLPPGRQLSGKRCSISVWNRCSMRSSAAIWCAAASPTRKFI